MCAEFFSIMIYDTRNEWGKQQAREKLEYFIEKEYVINLSRKMEKRSLKQNNYLYLLFGYFATESGYSVDEVKVDYFKKTCNPDLFYRVKVNKKGKQIKYLRSSSDLDVGEMTFAINRFRDWSAMVAGIYLPSPEDNEFLLHCEREIEANKEFIITQTQDEND